MTDLTSGVEVHQGGQRFVLVRVERGGNRSKTTRLVWQSRCLVCGADYETRSLRIFKSLTRRCAACVPTRRNRP